MSFDGLLIKNIVSNKESAFDCYVGPHYISFGVYDGYYKLRVNWIEEVVVDSPGKWDSHKHPNVSIEFSHQNPDVGSRGHLSLVLEKSGDYDELRKYIIGNKLK